MFTGSKLTLLALAAILAGAIVLAGCGASAPSADKMGAALVAAGDDLPKSDGPGLPEDVTLSPEALKKIEGAGVSEGSFRAGVKKMREDTTYAGEVMGAAMAEAMKKMGGKLPK